MYDKECLAGISGSKGVCPTISNQTWTKEDEMDIFDITAKEVNRDKLGEKVKDGQVVQITRMVTVVYNVYISEVLDGTDETDITLKALLEDEEGNTVNSVNLEYSGNVDIVDNSIISVDIV